MIDWSAVLQWLGGAAFLTLVGVGLRAVFAERGTVMASLLDDVKSLRAADIANDEKFQAMTDSLQKARTDLLDCRAARADLERDLREHKHKLDELEARVKKYTGKDAT